MALDQGIIIVGGVITGIVVVEILYRISSRRKRKK